MPVDTNRIQDFKVELSQGVEGRPREAVEVASDKSRASGRLYASMNALVKTATPKRTAIVQRALASRPAMVATTVGYSLSRGRIPK